MSHAWMHWVPALAVPALIASGVLVANASPSPTLPHRTVAQVETLAHSSHVTAFSGTVQSNVDLGLPQLPSSVSAQATASSGAASRAGSSQDLANVIGLLTGSHTARVYADGPQKARVQLLDQLGERDLVRNGDTAWLYNAAKQTATRLTLPERSTTPAPTPTPTATPPAAAQALLASLRADSAVTLGANTTVAGQAAYQLVLTPRDTTTLIGSAAIAVDGSNGMPLSVTVTARGATAPAVSLAFSSLTLSAPAASVFDFTPPSGTAVTDRTLGASHSVPHSAPPTGSALPTVVGTGWSAVLELPAGSVPADAWSSPLVGELTAAAPGLPGSHLLHTTLANVLVTADGSVFAGAVPVATLTALAQG